MKLRLAIFALLLALVTAFVLKNQINDFYLQFYAVKLRFFQKLQKVEEKQDLVVGEIKKTIAKPAPLRAKVDSPQAFLTASGTINWTNAQRSQSGLSQLSENTKLSASAQAKVDDMFEKQYFEHDSPTGEDVSDLIAAAGYQFITIGENLALGNYRDDQTLVQAWMDSEGHRANILNSGYSEIGVAVGRGLFQGKMTWLAVQHFGRPLSDCPQADQNLKDQIDQNNGTLSTMLSQIEAKKKEIDEAEPKHGPEYEQKVNDYNQLVSSYNDLLEETKNRINQYNNQTDKFNACIAR